MLAYSNLAYDFDNLARKHEEEQQKIEQQKQQARRLKLNQQRRMNAFLICAVILLSLSAYFMISKNVQLHETSDKIAELETELAMLESTTSQKIFELEQSVDLNTIEQIASTRLNMQRPEKYQIVYINVPTEDVTEVTAKDTEGVKNQVGSMMINMKKNFLGIFDLGLE